MKNYNIQLIEFIIHFLIIYEEDFEEIQGGLSLYKYTLDLLKNLNIFYWKENY